MEMTVCIKLAGILSGMRPLAIPKCTYNFETDTGTQVLERELNSAGSGENPTISSCEYVNEPSDSMKTDNFMAV
jgi:hypothetical protein